MTEKLKSAGNRLPDFAEEIRVLVGEGEKLPPVNEWHPERIGEIDIRIAKNGAWFYQGNKMERQSIVKLFSGILRKDDQDYFESCGVRDRAEIHRQIIPGPMSKALHPLNAYGRS